MQWELRKILGALMVQAGMLMEDAAPGLVTSLPEDIGSIEDRIDAMERMGRDVIGLAAASRVLLRIPAEDTATS